MRQLPFTTPGFKKAPIGHGGSRALGKRKTRRPLDPRQALHVVMRSELARGSWSFLHPRNQKHVDALIRQIADRHGIRLFRFANVGNHIHLLIRFRSRAQAQRFLKDLPGRIAQLITGSRKSCPILHSGNGQPRTALSMRSTLRTAPDMRSKPNSTDRTRAFWDGLVFTRIVHIGRDFDRVYGYLIKNRLEALGWIDRKVRDRYLQVIPLVRDGPPVRITGLRAVH